MESKFSGFLTKARPLPEDEPPESQPPAMHETSVARGRGRPRSKSSDPEYQPTTVILRKVTKRRAAHLLEDREMGKDLSELIEELLSEWLERQS
jgi:hypothetical protein